MSIRFEKVSKSFGTKRVLTDVSFEVASGEILFILGRSGMGKSVTLKHIVGLLRPDSGKVWIDGQDVAEVAARDPEALAALRRRCGMVFQQPALLDSLTIYENVAFGLRRDRSLTENQMRARVREKLALVHLDDPSILNRFPPELSYGMQKRVSLARTLAPGPEYLLF